jgi:signal transduction histidine kinase
MERFLHRRRGRRWDRSLGITIITGVVLLLVLGLVFAVAQGSRRITTSAASLHDADEALRSATIVRAQLALASHMVAVDQINGANAGDAIDLSLAEATIALGDLETAIALLEDDEFVTPDTEPTVNEFINGSYQLIALINSWAPADEHTTIGLPALFDTMVHEIVAVRNTLSANVTASDQLLGQIGNVARFLVGFLVPVAVILIYRELMRRQQRQAELETRLDAERQINSAREQFIANASHELRTPLTSIMGLSMLLGENETVHQDPSALELVSIIVGESEDLARMVEDLLTVARLDAGALHYSFEDVNITQELIDIAEGATRSGMNITHSSEAATIRADRLRFRQILRNLLSNAKKYGGPDIRLEGHHDSRTYTIEVIDNGTGIPEHLHTRLFERFIHQGNKVAAKDSVGLGLSIVHSLALDMGGSIQYAYTTGESHFTLRLPLTPTTTTTPTTHPHILEPHTQGPHPATQFTP